MSAATSGPRRRRLRAFAGRSARRVAASGGLREDVALGFGALRRRAGTPPSPVGRAVSQRPRAVQSLRDARMDREAVLRVARSPAAAIRPGPFVPCAASSACQAATAPGTVTCCGRRVLSSAAMRWLLRTSRSAAAAGARPEPFSATTGMAAGAVRRGRSSRRRCRSIAGSMTQSTATAATAASSALPPARSTSIAARVAAGMEVAAMPCAAVGRAAAGQVEVAHRDP